MKTFILDELGIERWCKRDDKQLPDAILVVMNQRLLMQEKMSTFFKQILRAVHLEESKVLFSASSSPEMLVPAHVRFVWFVGEKPLPLSKPSVSSPSLEVLMQDGFAKKQLYHNLCNAIVD